jgi:hypothetical protein
MKTKCIVCRDYFELAEETVELISEGWNTADSANTYDECFEMIQSSYYLDKEDMISDAYPGL